jgi:endogenous inhibitor of DNA gyrase (YacG/DUF329 family)
MKVDCPTCSKPVEWTDSNPYRPFCSDRCQLIDLGAWANEEYRVPAENSAPDDLDQGGDSSNY